MFLETSDRAGGHVEGLAVVAGGRAPPACLKAGIPEFDGFDLFFPCELSWHTPHTRPVFCPALTSWTCASPPGCCFPTWPPSLIFF